MSEKTEIDPELLEKAREKCYEILGHGQHAEDVDYNPDAYCWTCNIIALFAQQVRDEAVAKYNGFDGLLRFIQERLDEAYPESVFDGSSGDSGAMFVAGLWKLMNAIRARAVAGKGEK